MSLTLKEITTTLEDELLPEYLEVNDESSLHQEHLDVPENVVTHIFINIKSDQLNRRSKVQAHRIILNVLKKSMDKGLHAIRINLMK